MEIEQVRKELTHLLDNVVHHSRDFSEGRQIPSLEISFVLAKINKMQENLSVLRHLLEEEEKQRKSERRALKKEVEELSSIQPKEEVSHEEIVVKKVPEAKTEGLESDTESVEENNSVADKLQQSQTTKLVDAFNLNDRYLYANELFNKDMNAFNEWLKSVDVCASLKEADQIIISTKSQLNWEDENEHFITFIEIISRRFS